MSERYKCNLVTDILLTRKNERNGDTEVLLALRKNTGYHDGEYELPGGHVDAGEDIFQAMTREAKEELLIEIEEKDLKIAHIIHHYSKDRINFILTTNLYKGIPQIGEPDQCESLEWFSIKNLPINTMPKVKKILKNISNGSFYSKL